MREGRNEPSNLPYIVRSLATAYGMEEAEMGRQLRANAFEFFGMMSKTREEVAAAAAEANTTLASTGGKDGADSHKGKVLLDKGQNESDDDSAASDHEKGDGMKNPLAATEVDPIDSGEGKAVDGEDNNGPHGHQRRRKPQGAEGATISKKPVAKSYLVSFNVM